MHRNKRRIIIKIKISNLSSGCRGFGCGDIHVLCLILLCGGNPKTMVFRSGRKCRKQMARGNARIRILRPSFNRSHVKIEILFILVFKQT